MKSVIFSADEAREFHAAGSVECWRPVLPVPHEDIASFLCLCTKGKWKPVWGSGIAGKQMPPGANECIVSPHVPGEVRWVREPCFITAACEDGAPLIDPPVVYEADGATRSDDYEFATPARTMPRWASRATARCASVEVRQDDKGRWCWVTRWEKMK